MASNNQVARESDASPGDFTIAASPFCDTNCDVILQTSDNVLYHVHKAVLSLVSPVFDGMFTISPTDSNTQELHNGHPIIHLTENSASLYDFLTWCDPRSTESPTTLKSLKNALEVADKYSCDGIITRVESFMRANAHIWQHAPVVVYCICVRYKLQSIVPLAARMCLKIPMSQFPSTPEMEHITGMAMHNLTNYHFRAATAAASAALNYGWISRTDGGPTAYFAMSCSSELDCKTKLVGSSKWLAWFVDYMRAVAERAKVTPLPEVARDLNLLASIHSKISTSKCTNCHIHAHKRLVEFSELLANEISKRIAEVHFTIKY